MLSSRKDVCLWQDSSDCRNAVGERGSKPPEALARCRRLWAMGTGALSVLAGISFYRSCSWHSGPPKDDCNEVLFPDEIIMLM